MRALHCPTLLLCALLLMAGHSQAEVFDHGLWNQLLQRQVQDSPDGHASAVDYNGMRGERAQLQRYLDQLAGVSPQQFERWSARAQLAFLINAYNAWTVQLILRAWPELDSIKDLGSLWRSPWRQRFIPLLGATRTLDEIEHQLIRGSERYREPRIHFALNCASIGCPALRSEAYQASLLTRQLDQQTRRFLSDRSRNRADGRRLLLSPIFKWYREDFERGWQGYRQLSDFLLDYADALDLSPEQTLALREQRLSIDYLFYDWRLNSLEKR